MLKLDHVSFHYERATALVLDDVSYTFEPGKCYAIIGKSGSGKTTLISLISGLEAPTAGQVLYYDQPLEKLNLDKFRAHDIGVIFQSFNLILNMTARCNIELCLHLSGYKGDYNTRIDELLDRVGIARELGDRQILKLSGGEQQRIAIARALAGDPAILIADEPTGNLDGENTQNILDILCTLAQEENRCVIVVTHDDKVAEAADAVLRIGGGKIAF